MLRTCYLISQLLAWEYHEIYFNMIGIGKRAQRHEVCAHKGDYLAFGMVAQLLLFVPFIGPATFVSLAALRARIYSVCSHAAAVPRVLTSVLFLLLCFCTSVCDHRSRPYVARPYGQRSLSCAGAGRQAVLSSSNSCRLLR
jgi:hypothetical protein